MKKTFKSALFFAAVATLSLASCKKEANDFTPETVKQTGAHRTGSSNICGEPTTVTLIAGQHINAGTVTVTNDATNLYVTYSTANGWSLTELHLFAGACNKIPVNKPGNPIPGQFPYSANPAMANTYTFTIPLANLEDCFCVAAHAVVRNASGGTETAWGQGTRFVQKGNWAMKFNACKQPCVIDEGCVYGTATFFGDFASAWPSSTVTIGGYTYTQAEGNAIYLNTFQASSYAFGYIVLIKLSGTVPPNAPIQADVAVVEAWLATLGKLSPANQQAAPTSVQSSIDALYEYINSRFCNEREP